jgi:hypothetical protein
MAALAGTLKVDRQMKPKPETAGRFARVSAIAALALSCTIFLHVGTAQSPGGSVLVTGQSAECGIPIFTASGSAAAVLALVDGKEAAVIPAGLGGAARTAALSKICDELAMRRRLQSGVVSPKLLPEFVSARPPPPSPPPSPPPPPPAPPSPAPGSESGNGGTRGIGTTGATRGIALPDQYRIVSNVLQRSGSYLPRRDGMPTGAVLLDRRESARNRALCTGLMGRGTATVLPEAEARRRDPDGEFVVTHWLVRSAVADIGDCSELLAKYDFDRSEQVRAIYGLGDARGPVLMAFDPTGEMIFVDLGAASATEVTDAADKWMKLALSAPQSGPNAGKPPRPRGLVAGARQVFASIAGGLGALAKDGQAEAQIAFSDPVQGRQRSFRVVRAGSLRIGATFDF